MKIRTIQLVNYKSYSDSGPIELKDGFNFVVGPNNVGKTALLESFRLNRIERKAHRSADETPGLSATRPVYSDVVFELRKEEIKNLFAARNEIHIPFQNVTGDPAKDSADMLNNIFNSDVLSIKLRAVAASSPLSSEFWPSHQLFPPDRNRTSMRFNRSANGAFTPTGNVSGSDTFSEVISEFSKRNVYVFNAQRFEVSRYQTQETDVLEPNAANLPAVLSVLRRNDAKFNRFSSLIREIFPSIKSITVAPSENFLEIFIYNTDTDRPDLAHKLGDSGTGLSQVMAILYVSMTIEGGVIAIDEPSSFLHPSASRKLMQILTLFPDNQYILSTHSSEIITAVSADQVLAVSLEDGKSKVETLDLTKVDNVRSMLNRIGASLSDVFGLDSICWVEGQTEQICFPLILQKICRASPIGISFRAMRHTSDFERKRDDPRAAWELYAQISQGTALVPPAVSFNFDRDGRTSKVVEDMVRMSKKRAHFLDRETYENYLLHPRAITALLNSESAKPPTLRTVQKALRNAISANVSRKGVDAKIGCHGAKVLKQVFERYVTTHPFDKMTHSVALTRWIVENDPKFLRELADYVRGLIPADRLRSVV